jgi:hypothetical protein
VFDCGVWILISQETHANKIASKFKLMTLIGANKFGYIFMHTPNNVIFCSSNVKFIEDFFSKYSDNKGRKPEQPKSPTETHSESQDNHPNSSKFDNNDTLNNSNYRHTYQYKPSYKWLSNTNNDSAPFSFFGSDSSSSLQLV